MSGVHAGSDYEVRYFHRIIDDRIEKSIKGRRIGHTGERGRGLLRISTTVVMLARLVLPWLGVGNGGGRRVRQRV